MVPVLGENNTEAQNGALKPPLEFALGERIADRYILQEQIGKGGMGMVYHAQDTLINEHVALKFMHPKMLRTPKGKRLFLQEAQIARRLRHENIVAVHDVSWTQSGILYLSMEFLRGQSLRAYLRKHRSDRRLIDVRMAVTLLKQILAALEYAHRFVIHRDMKPENVMLLASERVKVLDFGLAKAVYEEYLDENAPQEDTDKKEEKKRVVGTLAYTAPEQRLMHPVDLRADIYTVGLLMYELFTLRTPLDESVDVEEVRSDVSPSLLRIMRKALVEEKELRWGSAGEFRQALEAAYQDSYLKAIISAPSTTTREQKSVSTEKMIYFEGGNFLMGNDAIREEAPEAEVRVNPFFMDQFPVTVSEYAAYLEATGAPEPRFWRDPQCNGPNQPVIGLTWNEANAYAAWAGKELPSESQWEFAARGKENRPYPWGALPPDTTLANFKDYLGMPSNVTMHEDGKTPEGVYDLSGNVFEWTRDPFVPYQTLRNAPEEAASKPRRTVRGGCWSSSASELRTTTRRGLFPESQLKTVGFRCVIEAEGPRRKTP